MPTALHAGRAGEPLLSVRGLATHFTVEGEVFRAVDGVDLDIARGEAVGLVGESGSGKTVTAMSVLQLIPDPPGRIVDGTIELEGTDLVTASDRVLRDVRGNRVACVFQDPLTTLNPVLSIGEQIVEMIRRHQDLSRKAARARAHELLEAVHIPKPERRLDEFPHELSGGMRQRVVIAMALANDPELLIADEPTTALDVTVQAEILDLFIELRERLGMALLFITHDFGVISELCDRVIVMYAGKVVEESPVDRVFVDPQHPYTRRLIDCVPALGQGARELEVIPGLPPALNRLPQGCAFAPRCDVDEDACRRGEIALRDVGDGVAARCIKPGARP
ncbi:MAG: ABC transporter ATP-binding protein [Egibacteraceae bacterium]